LHLPLADLQNIPIYTLSIRRVRLLEGACMIRLEVALGAFRSVAIVLFKDVIFGAGWARSSLCC
jgi:hypothetical protein